MKTNFLNKLTFSAGIRLFVVSAFSLFTLNVVASPDDSVNEKNKKYSEIAWRTDSMEMYVDSCKSLSGFTYKEMIGNEEPNATGQEVLPKDVDLQSLTGTDNEGYTHIASIKQLSFTDKNELAKFLSYIKKSPKLFSHTEKQTHTSTDTAVNDYIKISHFWTHDNIYTVSIIRAYKKASEK